MKRKQAKKYFNTEVWFDTNLTHLAVNSEKYNAKKGNIAKKYGVETSLLDYIVEDFQVFDRVQFVEQIEFACDKEYEDTLLKLIQDDVFSQFCESAHLNLDKSVRGFEKEAIIWFSSLDDEKLKEANSIFDLSELKLSELTDSKAASYNNLFEIVECRDTTLYLMMMNAHIKDNTIFIGKYNMQSGERKHNLFNLKPEPAFEIKNTILSNGKKFTQENWKDILNQN